MTSKELPIEKEIKGFIKSRLESELKDPEKFAEDIYKNIKKHWVFGKRSFQPWVESPDINPFVNMVLTRSGLLPLFTLHLLFSREMFGSEIMNEIENRTSKTWSPNPGAVYPLLKELEGEKFVKGRWSLEKEHPRRIYRITDKGKKEYRLLKAVLKEQLSECIVIFNNIFDDIFTLKSKKQDRKDET
ncbi:MAG: PadR family transcriptional regulator [Actinomycetota bacterium]